MKKTLIGLLLLSVLLMLALTSCMTDGQKDAEIWEAINSNNFDRARYLVNDYYQKNFQKAFAWRLTIAEEENKDYLESVKVLDGWKWAIEEQYSHIRGSVTNDGNKTIDYFKVTVRFMDSQKNVIDTGYTNSSETLGPRMAKAFEIMHKYSSAHKYAVILVEEVSVK